VNSRAADKRAGTVNPIRYAVDAVGEDELRALWQAVWNTPPRANLGEVLARSMGQVSAYHGTKLIGFVNVASDGGEHAFLVDTAVHPEFRRQGIGSSLVRQAIVLARERRATWLHVDFEPQHTAFYRRCGFRPTEAGLIAL
jgi:ribosomal protein S18 acetylase RimI-like enzyme